MLSFSEFLDLLGFLLLGIELDTKLIEELLKVMFLDLFFVVFINLGTGFVSDFKFVDLICDIVTNVYYFVIDPSSAQESIVRSFLIDINPKSQIDSTLSDRFWYGFGLSGPNKTTEGLDFLL